MTNYLAITIGPIIKTMQLAQKTREFWAASMLFSILSKYLCEALIAAGVKEKEFLLPSQQNFNRQIQDIGLYADRIICKASENVWKKFETDILNVAFEKFSNEIQKIPGSDGLTSTALQNYFKVYAVYEPSSTEGIAKKIFNHLNYIELYYTGASEANTQKNLKAFLENVNTKYDREEEKDKSITDSLVLSNFVNAYTSQELEDLNGYKRIPSIVEISTKPLQNKKPKDKSYTSILNKHIWKNRPNENELFKQLKNQFPEDIKNYHRYIAILQADGDKLGTYVSEREDENELIDIQDALFNWGTAALTILQQYDVLPIYIGGDDLMCFAPVNNGDKTILDLAKEINEAYCNIPVLEQVGSTLSIAIKIAYYKAPMGESYEDTFPLLKETAKKHKFNKSIANSCAISYDKHSGQPHRFVFNFNDEYNTYIKPIISKMITGVDKRSFINSVFYKIRANEQLLWLASKGSSDRLWYFFENNFEEAKPKRKGTKSYQFLEAIKNYLHYLFDKWKDGKIDEKNQEMKATNQLYSALKMANSYSEVLGEVVFEPIEEVI